MMLSWAEGCGMPIHILLTKADKLKKGPANNSLLAVRKELAASQNSVSVQLFSSLKRSGLDELRNTLTRWLDYDAVDETELLADDKLTGE